MECYGLAWIWMGDADQAHEDRLPDFGPFITDDGFAFARGNLKVAANYQLVVDNLLDLTHGQFLHPAFGNPGTPKFDTKLEGSTVWAKRSEEHTSELQSLMRNSYAVFCLKKKKKQY